MQFEGVTNHSPPNEDSSHSSKPSAGCITAIFVIVGCTLFRMSGWLRF